MYTRFSFSSANTLHDFFQQLQFFHHTNESCKKKKLKSKWKLYGELKSRLLMIFFLRKWLNPFIRYGKFFHLINSSTRLAIFFLFMIRINEHISKKRYFLGISFRCSTWGWNQRREHLEVTFPNKFDIFSLSFASIFILNPFESVEKSTFNTKKKWKCLKGVASRDWNTLAGKRVNEYI